MTLISLSLLKIISNKLTLTPTTPPPASFSNLKTKTTLNFLPMTSSNYAKSLKTELNHILLEQNQQLTREKDIAQSTCDYLQHQLNILEAETEHYTDVPELWREHVDSSIDFWQKTFSAYCHDVNRATLRVFIASHSNYRQTDKQKKLCMTSLKKPVPMMSKNMCPTSFTPLSFKTRKTSRL